MAENTQQADAMDLPLGQELVPQNEKSSAETSPPQQSTGWGGWGSGWGTFSSALSGAVNSVTEALEKTNISDIGTNIKKTTLTSFDKVYEVLDPDFLREQEIRREREIARGEQSATPDASESKPARDDDSTPALNAAKGLQNIAAEKATAVLNSIDKSFDYASHALGSSLMAGYRKIEEAKIGERAKQTISQVTREVQQSTAIRDGLQSGEAIVKETMGALETLGEKALHFMGLDESDDERAPTPRQITIRTLFENNAGSAHIQALDMLSTESQIRANAFEEEGDNADVDEYQILWLEQAWQDAKAKDESVLATEEGFQKMLALLKVLAVDSDVQLKSIQEIAQTAQGYKNDELAAHAKDIGLVVSADEDTQISAATELLATVYGKSMYALASIAEKSCEQLLRVAESVLMRVAEEQRRHKADEAGPRPENLPSPEEVSNALRDVTVLLLAETNIIARLYSEALDDVEDLLNTMPLAIIQRADQQRKVLKSTIETDFKFARAQEEFAAGSLLPIVRLLQLSTGETIASRQDKIGLDSGTVIAD